MPPTYSETRDALLNESIHLAYQPVHHLGTGELKGYEALARWEGYPPPHISAIVEGHNLQGLWIECQVAQVNRVLATLPMPLWVSLNIDQSVISLRQLPEILNCTPEPSRLVIEVLEAVRLDDTTAAALQELQCNHVLRADDVGSLEYSWIDRLVGGYAELFDGLKLCKGLTYDVHSNRRTALFCAAMLAIADELELHTTGEWVRHPVQRQWLHEHGCDCGQGELFGMPGPAPQKYPQPQPGV